MLRYLRLYALLPAVLASASAMHFRLDFFFRVGMDLLWYCVHLGFFSVLYRHTQTLGGLSHDQVLVFVGAVFVADALTMTVFSNNLWWLPIYVNKGDLDYYLVRPVSSLFFLSLREFAANSFLNLLMAVGVLTWALVRYPDPLGPGALMLFAGMMLTGCLLSYACNMLFIIPVFWLQSPAGLRELWWSIGSFMNRPHRVYSGWLRRLFVTAIPVAFIVSYPVETLFAGTQGGRVLLHLAAVVLGLFLVMVWFWKRGLRAYASASS